MTDTKLNYHIKLMYKYSLTQKIGSSRSFIENEGQLITNPYYKIYKAL